MIACRRLDLRPPIDDLIIWMSALGQTDNILVDLLAETVALNAMVSAIVGMTKAPEARRPGIVTSQDGAQDRERVRPH